MELKYKPRFLKDLAKVKNSKVRNEIVKVIESIHEAKSIHEVINLKKLYGSQSAFRIKVSEYRIGIYISKNVVIFCRVMLRKDIYKYFP